MISSLLISALILVESGGNDRAIGDHGRAYGCLQITQSVLDDVNQFTGQHLVLTDCFDRTTSVKIALVYLNHYVTEGRLGYEPQDIDYALTWNRGPRGPWLRDESAIDYWGKVERAMRTPRRLSVRRDDQHGDRKHHAHDGRGEDERSQMSMTRHYSI